MRVEQMIEIILASGSPRRVDLLEQAGLLFKTIVSGCEEVEVEGEGVKAMVERLASLKAQSVASKHPNALVIGADTTVFLDNHALGKPRSIEEACAMLDRIQGRTHEVWGGIALVRESDSYLNVWSHTTRVTMMPMDTEQIKNYVATGEPMDKAGAYAIQGIGLQYVDSIQGSYSNVVGLNIASLLPKIQEYLCR